MRLTSIGHLGATRSPSPASKCPPPADEVGGLFSVLEAEADDVTQRGRDSPRFITFESPERPTVASYKGRLEAHRRMEIRLRKALARDDDLLRQKDELIRNQTLLSKESDHRLLNNLQMVVSLLSLQSRAAANAEAASQLAAAADRIATIGRMHQRLGLHYCDGIQSVAFKQFCDDLCHDFSMMLSAERCPERSFPNWEGSERKTSVTVNGDDLSYTADPISSATGPYIPHVTWKRAK